MKLLTLTFLLLLSAVEAFGQLQGVVNSTNAHRTINWPADFVNSAQALSGTAFFKTSDQPIPAGSVFNGANFLNVSGMQLGCYAGAGINTCTGMTFRDSSASGFATLTSSTQQDTYYIVAWKRNPTSFAIRMWTTDGTVLVTKTTNAAWVRQSGNINLMQQGTNGVGIPGWSLHNLCIYATDKFPDITNAQMPQANRCDSDAVGQFSFDGNLTDAKALVPGLTISTGGTITYTSSPTGLPPVMLAGVTGDAVAGSPLQFSVDAVTFDGSTGLSNSLIEYVSGPTVLEFDNPHSATPKAYGAVMGEYTVRVSGGGLAAVTVGPISVVAKDSEGFYLLTTNNFTGAASIPFTLGPGVAKVRVSVRKATGGMLPDVECTVSPCVVPVDNRGGHNYFRIKYLNSSNVLLYQSTKEQKLAVTQAPRSVPRNLYLQPFVHFWASESYGDAGIPAATKYVSTLNDRINGGKPGGSLPLSVYAAAQYNPQAWQTVYVDTAGATPGYWYQVRHFFSDVGFGAPPADEVMYLHLMNGQDYNTTSSFVWTNSVDNPSCSMCMDKFDYAEAGNGVMTLTGDTVSVDVTNDIFNSAAPHIQVTDGLLIRSILPFDEVRFTFNVPASGCTVGWQYYRAGAWAPLTLASDTTANLTTNGTVRFVPPVDWTYETYANAGSYAKRQVRAQVSGCTTPPTIAKLSGDTWMTSGKLRSWSTTDPNRVNVGTENEYNPNPPANQTARFKHQSRLQGIWAHNTAMFNVTAQVNGVYAVARWLNWYRRDMQTAFGGTLFVDNGVAKPNLAAPYGPYGNATNLANLAAVTEYGTGGDMVAAHITSFLKVKEYVKALYNPNARICANNVMWELVKHADCFYDESFKNMHIDPIPRDSFSITLADTHDQSAGPARLASAQNTNGTEGWIEIYDNRQKQAFNQNAYFDWDKGNRGPIGALASFAMYANPYTRYMYHTGINFWYYELDDFFERAVTAEWNTGSNDIPATYSSSSSPTYTYLTGIDLSTFPNSLETVTGDQEITWTKLTTGCPASANPCLRTDTTVKAIPPPTPIYRVTKKHLSAQPLLDPSRVIRWGQFFPAMFVDIGVPDTSGYNGGNGNLAWKTGPATNTANGIGRRDFTKAIALWSLSGGAAETSTVSGGNCVSGNAGCINVTNGSSTFTLSNATQGYFGQFATRRLRLTVGSNVPDQAMWTRPTYVATNWTNATTGTLDRPYEGTTQTNQPYILSNFYFNAVYGDPIVFASEGMPSVLYPLTAGGRTDNSQCNYTSIGGADYRTADGGCTAIRLRSAEGAILMREPIQ